MTDTQPIQLSEESIDNNNTIRAILQCSTCGKFIKYTEENINALFPKCINCKERINVE